MILLTKLYMPLGKKALAKLGLSAMSSTLFKAPKREKGFEEPHTTVYESDSVHQADLIYLPHDQVSSKVYKYALVVVDLATGLTDAEAITDKTGQVTLEALKVIYSRSVLNLPNRMETDPGSEFKAEFAAYLKSINVELRHGKAGRHRQQSMVENRNYTIGMALNLRMASIEQVTGKTSRDWVGFLPTVIAALNEQTREQEVALSKRKKKPKDPADSGPFCGKKNTGSCEILDVGTRVRIPFEEPVDNVTGKKLHGKFRAGDKRWDDRVRKIYQQVIRPDQPMLYIVTEANSDKPAKVAHTIQQIQVVRGDEKEIDAKKLNISESNVDYQVKSLKERKKIKGKVHFLVRWVGYADEGDDTWEPRANLVKSGALVKKMVLDFEKQ